MRVDGSALSGQGRLTLNGTLLPMQQRAELAVKGARFEAVNTSQVQLLVSPDLQLALSPQKVSVRGELLIPQALIQTPKLEQSAVSESPDLVVRSQEGAESSRGPELDVDLRVVLGESVRVDAFGFNGLLNGALNLQQGRGLARGTGSVGVASGQYRLYGQNLEISRGNVIFTGGPLSNPGLDLRVEREVDDVIVGALVGGTLRKPDLKLTSSPAMPDNRILSYLVLGRAPDATSSGEQQMLMKLALSLGAKGGTSITEKLTQSLNVDEIGFSSGETVDDTSFYIGKYLSPELYIKYGVGLINPVNTFLMRYQLSKRLSLETETSAEGSGGDLIYSFESD
nr:translocation/assembly module TamB domain-containing protein [Marinobacterium ramblicola]